jgi:hypothetical protein
MYMCLNQHGLETDELYSDLFPSSTRNGIEDPPEVTRL